MLLSAGRWAQRRDLRLFSIWLAIALGSGVLLWLLWVVLGRAIATSLAGRFLVTAIDHPVSPLLINADKFIIGQRTWPMPRTGRFNIIVTTDKKNRLVISAEGNAFTLGPVTKIWAEPREPQYQFSPEKGDTVTSIRSNSRIEWPTSPFRYSIMGAKLPSWRRYVYDRLRWEKISGASLEIVWRDEQAFYAGTGWTDTNTNQLASVAIHRGRAEEAVIHYLISKGWSRDAYHLEWTAVDRGQITVAVIATADASALQPGSGKSIVLQVDQRSGAVLKELALQ